MVVLRSTPYIEVKINKRFLKGIVVVPCNNFKMTKQALNSQLYPMGINQNPIIKVDVNIVKSKIPYRVIK